MISATRRKRMTDNDTGVVCYVRTDSGVDGFGRAGDDGTTSLLTGHEVLKTFEAAPEEPVLSRRQSRQADRDTGPRPTRHADPRRRSAPGRPSHAVEPAGRHPAQP